MRKSAIFLAIALIFSACKTGEKAAESDGNKKTAESQSEKIDFDFTKMNFNIATAQVFNMAVEPDKYEGKTVRFRGQFVSIQEEGFSERFFSVLQYDATACCQTGFMFFLPEGKKYPEDYPEEMSEIEVVGTLTTGNVDGMDIFYLACDSYTPISES